MRTHANIRFDIAWLEQDKKLKEHFWITQFSVLVVNVQTIRLPIKYFSLWIHTSNLGEVQCVVYLEITLPYKHNPKLTITRNKNVWPMDLNILKCHTCEWHRKYSKYSTQVSLDGDFDLFHGIKTDYGPVRLKGYFLVLLFLGQTEWEPIKMCGLPQGMRLKYLNVCTYIIKQIW